VPPRLLYPRPSNRAGWLLESLGDALALAAGAHLEAVLDPQLAQAIQSVKRPPLAAQVMPPPLPLAASAASAASACTGKGPALKAALARRSLAAFAQARRELALVYGCPAGASPMQGPGPELLLDLDSKIEAIKRALLC